MGNSSSVFCRRSPTGLREPDSEPSSTSSTPRSAGSQVDSVPGGTAQTSERGLLDEAEGVNSETEEPLLPLNLSENLAEGCVRGRAPLGVPREELRYCAIWEVRNHPELTGIHWSRGTKAYHRLRSISGSYRSLRWQRVDSLEAANELFQREAPLKNLDPGLGYRVLGWP